MSKSIQDGRDAGAFITSDLDDFGLDPYAFRIYGRIARRAGTRDGCFESIDHMAQACRIDRKKVYEALKILLKHRLIVKEPNTGKPSNYWLTSREEWIPITDLYRNRNTEPIPKSEHHLYRNRNTTYTEIGTPPIPKSEHKGNPIKGIPLMQPHQGGDDADFSDTRSQSIAAKAANLAKKQLAREKVKESRRDFIQDSPWGDLATEMGKDPKEVFNAFKSHLEACGKSRGKDDPVAWGAKIASDIWNSPGSELNNPLWLEFAEAYRKGQSPQIGGSEQKNNSEWIRLAKELGHITAFNAELQTCTVPGEGRRPIAELQARYPLDYLKNQIKRFSGK